MRIVTRAGGPGVVHARVVGVVHARVVGVVHARVFLTRVVVLARGRGICHGGGGMLHVVRVAG